MLQPGHKSGQKEKGMQDYDDIQTITPVENWEEIHPLDLREEAKSLSEQGETYQIAVAGAYNEESITILYIPAYGRAGIAWGSDSEWTDADSVDDALRRFFGIEDKEMVN